MLKNVQSLNVKESEKKNILDLTPDLDPHQNWIGSFLTHTTSFNQVLWNSVPLFLCNLAYNQTEKHTNGLGWKHNLLGGGTYYW